MCDYHYLIVGSGLYGATFAREMTDAGYRCLIIDKRNHAGGNVYCETIEGIVCHKYGPHIFHTNDRDIWDYVNRYAEFNRFTFMPVANYRGEIYNLPFNMNTFNRFWGVTDPEEARRIIEGQSAGGRAENLEQKAIASVGVDIYEKLIKGYTQKQWGRPCSELPAFIISRLPVRYTYDNSYFSDRYQGIPIGGYNQIIEGLTAGIEVRTGCDYLADREYWMRQADHVIYTGPIDEYYGYKFGALEYRSLRFETEVLETENFQGNAVVNYPDALVPYTRIIEHKHFEFGRQKTTVISREYPETWGRGSEPFYPVNDAKNGQILSLYRGLAASDPGVTFGGRLGEYRYYDMHQVIGAAIAKARIMKESPVKTRLSA